jgi:hypothetical protein
MSLAKELAKLRAALDAPWPEEIWKAKAEIAERELSATKDEYCETAFALTEQTERAEKAEAEVERLRGLLNAHAEFLIKNGFYRESRDLMGGSWSDGFVALAKKCGINPCDQ